MPTPDTVHDSNEANPLKPIPSSEEIINLLAGAPNLVEFKPAVLRTTPECYLSLCCTPSSHSGAGIITRTETAKYRMGRKFYS